MKKQIKLKKLPIFGNEDEEREFWATHDSTEYVDWSKARVVVFPNLKSSTKSITIRMTESLIDNLKVIANRKDVPYQSLIKIYLSEKVKEEYGSLRH
ncbi:MAG: BrnA antitoxin family protein [Candidatus Roizmanbacteria bacterium]|nr:BrnA antitoxin family protein [Candidatus Roizmanbacteria bacterium]